MTAIMKMNEAELRQYINELAQMEVKLAKKGGPEKSGKLFEGILEKQQDLLEKLGLPNTPYYQGLLQFDSIPWDKEIDDLIKLLYREAEGQEKTGAKPELDLLIDAKKSNRDPMFILPKLGIETHVYTLFVYNNILMYGQDDPENILNEFKLVKSLDLLDEIGRMGSSPDWINNAEEKIVSLESKGLKYIRQYALDIINYLKGMGFKVNGF
jgi:hypothetical protein